MLDDPFIVTHRARIVARAAETRLPAMYGLNLYSLATSHLAVDSQVKRGRGGVEYEDLILGEGPIAGPGSVVTVRYDLSLNRGEKVQENQESSFRVGSREVVAGLEYGVEGMRLGGKRRLRVGPHLGYREEGVPGVIPPSAVLEFCVTLVAVSQNTRGGT